MSRAETWKSGISAEIDFWREWIATQGLRWPESYRRKLDPNAPLLVAVEEEVRKAADPINILDVGCGPASYMGRVSPSGRTVSCVYADALAPAYMKLWQEAGITPPHPIHAVEAERLSDVFAPNSFAIVFARNCMDHMSNPLEALRQMLQVTRPGGAVIVLHYANEGKKENFVGLHQWNLYAEDGRYYLGDQDGNSIDLCREVSGMARLEELIPENGCPGDDPAMQKVLFRKLPR